jgi:Ca-activated chloride channel family protein
VRAILALCLLLASSAGVAAQDGGDDTVTLKSDLVVVPVSVRHEKGGPVLDMKAEEFALAEDGANREISFFNRDTAPVDVVLLVDSSGSVEGVLDTIQQAALSFTKQLRPEDSFSIVAFADRPVILLDWSADVKAATSALRSIEPSGSTALYGAVVATVYERFDKRPADHRRALVVLTDGDDTISSVTSRSAARAALAHDTSVYVVSIGRVVGQIYEGVANNSAVPTQKRTEFRDALARIRRAEERIEYLADQTGGRVLYPSATGDLKKAYGEVAEEIRSRYLLGYYPPDALAAGFHTIAVTTPRKGVRLHARQGYFKDEPRPAAGT